MEKVTLEYRREHRGSETRGPKTLVIGRVLYEPEDGMEEEQAFETESFGEMMGMYAKVLKEHPEAQAYFQRKDRPGTPVLRLDPLTTEGLRERTEETIDKLSNPPPVRIDLRKRIKGTEAEAEEKKE